MPSLQPLFLAQVERVLRLYCLALFHLVQSPDGNGGHKAGNDRIAARDTETEQVNPKALTRAPVSVNIFEVSRIYRFELYNLKIPNMCN